MQFEPCKTLKLIVNRLSTFRVSGKWFRIQRRKKYQIPRLIENNIHTNTFDFSKKIASFFFLFLKVSKLHIILNF